MLKVIPTPPLQSLHLKVIETSSPDLCRKEDPLSPTLFPEECQKVLGKYGSPFGTEFYQPHLSLVRIYPEIFKEWGNPFQGSSWLVEEFSLSKREEAWKTVACFPVANSPK